MSGASSGSKEPLAPSLATSTHPIRSRRFRRPPKTSASRKKTAGSWGHTRSGKSPHDLPPVSRSSYQNARKRCDVIRLVEIALVDVDLWHEAGDVDSVVALDLHRFQLVL